MIKYFSTIRSIKGCNVQNKAIMFYPFIIGNIT